MSILNKTEPLILLAGDVLSFLATLWIMLFLRYGQAPSAWLFKDHLLPFSFLFVIWIIVFFIAGLYEKHTLILRSKLPTILVNAEIANSILAVVFFYSIPYFGITPKINLFIYLAVSLIFVFAWRINPFSIIVRQPRQNALVIGSGKEMNELEEEVNNNQRYGIKFISSVDVEKLEGLDFQEEVVKRVYSENVSIVAVDLKNEKMEPLLPKLYNLIFSKVRFIDMHKIYEDIFDRIPLSLVQYNWFIENISSHPKVGYDFLKRIMDIFLSFVLGIVSLVFYPLVSLLIKLEDGGEIFVAQNRIGKNNKLIKIYKFRSMNKSDCGATDEVKNNCVTKVGKFLRKTRIDELPQLWSIFKGDLSLIGPRPELPSLVSVYEKEIPYYNIRHLIKPGLSGWAQLYHDTPPKFGSQSDATKMKLSYDLYYIKNRSFILDIKIAFKTIKILLSSSGL